MALLLSALFTACLLSPLGGMVAQAAPADPALACNPAFAAFARQHPTDWEQRTDPTIKPLIGWQRLVGCHAQVFGWADEQPNPTYTHPRVVIDVAGWDHTDLFSLGLPRTYDGKPVVIHETVVPSAGIGQPGLAALPPAPTLPTSLPSTGAGSEGIGGLGGAFVVVLSGSGAVALYAAMHRFGPGEWQLRRSIQRALAVIRDGQP